MFFKLAVRNVKRQFGNYLIYFMTVALTVALLFAINGVIYSEKMQFYTSADETIFFYAKTAQTGVWNIFNIRNVPTGYPFNIYI